MGQRNVDRRPSKLGESSRGPSMKTKLRRTIRPRKNLNLPPSNRARVLVSGKRLVRCFLGGEADRNVLRRKRLRGEIGELSFCEKPGEHSIAIRRVHPLDAHDIYCVDAETQDHERVDDTSSATS